jgi:hypothetical protein
MANFLKLLHQTKDDPEIKDKFNIYLCDEVDATLWNVVMPSDSFLEMAPDIFHGLEQNALIFHRAAQVKLELRFPLQYPSGPPFVRVISPRFKQYTGHVTIGGSICAEFLTSSGWNSTFTVPAVLLYVSHDSY